MSRPPVLDARCLEPLSGSGYTSSEHAEWHPSKPGIWTKRLYGNPSGACRTLLVRMDPGATSAPHAHDGFEQVFVISGSFEDDAHTLRAGDYCCRAPGTVHSAHSATGALVLAVYTPAG